MAETVRQHKVLGIIWFIVPVVVIILAFVAQPVGEWGFFGIALAAILAVMALVGLRMAITGKGNIIGGQMSLKAQRIIAIIGTIAALVLVVVYVVSIISAPTATAYLTVGVWVCIGALFIDSLIALRNP